MKTSNKSRRLVVCLVTAATTLLIGFRVVPGYVRANAEAIQKEHQAAEPGIPTVTLQVANSESGTVLPISASIADTESAGQTLPGAQASPDLPPVQEFMLTPPNVAIRIYKTNLSIRFAKGAAEPLAEAIPMTLGNQRVVLRRSKDDPDTYGTAVDFNWDAFLREQAERQELAHRGAQVPVFDGHRLLRMESMQFVDPEQIQLAMQSHQSVQFTSRVLQGAPSSIIADHELMITNIGVVEDPNRTWDPCSRTGKQMGAWTFGALMTAIAGDDPSTHLVADLMVQNWLKIWSTQQTVNHFPVDARLGILGVIRNWRAFAQDQNGNVDVSQAPFQLNAIVNRVDLAQSTNPAGELRFVFGYAPCQGGEGQPAKFNVIVEYRVPVAECSWASQWHGLDALLGPKFNVALQNITDQVVVTNAGQNLSQVRTNEAFTSALGIWEQRQFALSSGALREVPIAQTPNGDTASGRVDFNQQTCAPASNCKAGVLTDYINTFEKNILDNKYTVPPGFPAPTTPFLGGSAFNGPFNQFHHQLVYWQGNPAPRNNQARSIFSENTCNGCHGRETFVEFQQVENRQPGPPSTAVPSALSAFLVGCSTSSQGSPLTDQTGPCPSAPTNACNLQTTLTQHDPPCISWVQDPGDPTGSTVNQFSEISRRAQNLSTVLQGCSSDGMLYLLARPQLSSVH